VAWECIAGRRLFTADDMIATFAQIVDAEVPSLRGAGYQISEALSRTIQRGLEKNPANRFQTAEEMAREIEAALRPASREAVRAWVEKLAGPTLAARLKVMQRIETGDVDATVAQVPVDISPDQSGKLPTLRAALAATPGDDGGTFPATLATLSIASAVPRGRGWKLAAALALVVVVFGAGGAFALLSRSVTNERQAGTPLAEVTPPPAAQPAATAALPTVATTAEPASSAVEVDAGAPVAATALELSPPPATRSTRPVAAAAPKKPGSSASGVAAPSPPPPVDPLSDQR
jgi:serine/threonine-protein kinase